jgi:hypothetical protein
MTGLGIILSLACALLTNVAFLCKHRGAVLAPTMSARHPMHSIAGLFRSRWWAIGYGIGVVAWALHAGALAIAPLSLVQVVIAGGLVLLALPAERWFGFSLGRREWVGLTLSAIGLAFLMITATGGEHDGSRYSTTAMIAFEGGALGIGLGMLLSGRSERVQDRLPVLLGAASGLLIGVSDVAVKALAETVPSDPAAILTPWTATALLASVLALYALGRALQTGGAIQVIALSSVAANLAAITGGVLVFGDPVGSGALGIVARGAAFAAVIVAAGLVQGPVRVAEALADGSPRPAG